MSNQSNTLEGGSNHTIHDAEEPKEFKIQVLPAGSAPASKTHQPAVGEDLAPGQPNNTADEIVGKSTEGSAIDVKKGLGNDIDGHSKKEKDEARHEPDLRSATEKEPEIADTL